MEKQFNIIPVVAIAVFLFALHLVGFWPIIGGHPYWSASATIAGAILGIVVFYLLILTLAKSPQTINIALISLIAICGISLGVSMMGKVAFVGSYAENHMAGRVWYFGFILFIGALMSSLSMMSQAIRQD